MVAVLAIMELLFRCLGHYHEHTKVNSNEMHLYLNLCKSCMKPVCSKTDLVHYQALSLQLVIVELQLGHLSHC